jgi:hypothetical protein
MTETSYKITKIPKSHTSFSWTHQNSKSIPKSHTSYSWLHKTNYEINANLIQKIIRGFLTKSTYNRNRNLMVKMQKRWKKLLKKRIDRKNLIQGKSILKIQDTFRKFIKHRKIKRNIKLSIKPKPILIFSWEPRHHIEIKIPKRIKWPCNGYFEYDETRKRTNFYLPLKSEYNPKTKQYITKKNKIYAYYDNISDIWFVNKNIMLKHYRYIDDINNKYSLIEF